MNTFIVWGTGHEANKLMRRLSAVNDLAKNITNEIACDVAWFLDSDVEKTKQPFFDKEVKLAHNALLSKEYPIVVAVVKNKEILLMLEKQGYRRRKDYLTLTDFHEWLWQELCFVWHLIEALGVKNDDFIVGMHENPLPQDMPDRFDRFQQKIRAICKQRGHEDWFTSLQDMLVPAILFHDCDWPNKEDMCRKLLGMVGVAKYIESLEYIYGNHTELAAQWMIPAPVRKNKRTLPRTVAMYFVRYYNGGTERVISKLLAMFQAHGYRMVLFTDEIREDMEYPLPARVQRVLLGFEGGRRSRCERLLEALRRYEVDIFCSHSYDGNILYDIFCVHQAGVPVMLEMHNIFSFITDVLTGKSLSLGRRVDALVTLSRVDEMFWHLLGCRSIYIPNPVDAAEEREHVPIPNTILWLQRIEQNQKQVMELPAILEYVVHMLPEARLQIVGEADDPDIEVSLREMFEERGLMGHVDFLGFHMDVEKYYRQASVMLMTSAFEGFSMTLAESKRYGTPVVMYELPYLELLRDGRGYIAVPQRDQHGAADALVRVLSDEALRKRLSWEAKASLEEFSKFNIMKAWEDAMALAMTPKKEIILSEEERTFGEIQKLLLDLAERMQLSGNVN